jgi:hypothetical protein
MAWCRNRATSTELPCDGDTNTVADITLAVHYPCTHLHKHMPHGRTPSYNRLPSPVDTPRMVVTDSGAQGGPMTQTTRRGRLCRHGGAPINNVHVPRPTTSSDVKQGTLNPRDAYICKTRTTSCQVQANSSSTTATRSTTATTKAVLSSVAPRHITQTYTTQFPANSWWNGCTRLGLIADLTTTTARHIKSQNLTQSRDRGQSSYCVHHCSPEAPKPTCNTWKCPTDHWVSGILTDCLMHMPLTTQAPPDAPA